MNGDFSEERQENENLTAWRLGRVEKGIEELSNTLKQFAEISDRVLTNSLKIQSLEKSRDRMITALSILGTSTLMIVVQQIFNVFERVRR